MLEGQMYPELRRMSLERATLSSTRIDPGYWERHWDEKNPKQSLREIGSHVQSVEIEAVRITMPREDFERMMSIYTAHYHAANRNPAVVETWNQYRTLVALTDR